MIIACDVLIYMGDLQPVFVATHASLQPYGWFAFSVEVGEEEPYSLQDTGRYAHHEKTVKNWIQKAGYNIHLAKNIIGRVEDGKDVHQLLVIAKKKSKK